MGLIVCSMETVKLCKRTPLIKKKHAFISHYFGLGPPPKEISGSALVGAVILFKHA